MTLTKSIGLTALVIIATFTSCQKYEDGPAVSLTPRADRVTNTWIFAYAEEDGQNVSSDYDQYELYMNSAGEAQLDAQFTSFGVQYTTSTTGSWYFTNDEENLRLDFEDDSQDNEFEILRLKKDELWLRDLDQNLELHLLPK